MKKARSEHSVFFDVDDTLIMWDENYTQPFEGAVEVTCPHDGQVSFHRPHLRHIEFLKKQHAKGYSIVVWSAGGVGWANAAVEALELVDYVDFVTSKPQKWVDDLLTPGEVLGSRMYLDEEGYSV